MAEVHGNRTHLTDFGRYTGFEVEKHKIPKTLTGRASPHFRHCQGSRDSFPILAGSRGKVTGRCNRRCNPENALDFSSSDEG